MTVYLLWTTVPKSDLLGIFETQALAQTWLDSQMRRGAMTRGEHILLTVGWREINTQTHYIGSVIFFLLCFLGISLLSYRGWHVPNLQGSLIH